MRWLSLRGWHWWLQWWADRLWQWEDLGISGAWESSALGGENRKHHELLFKDIYTLCVWKLSFHSWVFHFHGVVPELKCYIDNQILQMIALKLLQPTTSFTPLLGQSKQAAKKWLRCKFGQKGGLGTLWLIGVEWYWDSFCVSLLLFSGLVHPNWGMSVISIDMSQLDSPLLVIHPCLNVSLCLAF